MKSRSVFEVERRIITLCAVQLLAVGSLLVGCADSDEEEPAIVDRDQDNVADDVDNCPDVANPLQLDVDNNGVGDVCEPAGGQGEALPSCADRDRDGDCDDVDNCPDASNPNQADADGDGIGDACDTEFNCDDTDLDGVCDANDNCPTVANSDQSDADRDRIGDACDSLNDNDRDGVPNEVDNCPDVYNSPQLDRDDDGIGDICDDCVDVDGDDVCTPLDNCELVANADQADADGDGVGDVCDACNDVDVDAICDDVDNCATVANADQADADEDGIGDVCDTCPDDSGNDEDEDGVCAAADNCSTVANADQADADGDGVGDVCDACPDDNPDDPDEDLVCQSVDNCPDVSNSDQLDSDADGYGDACACLDIEYRDAGGECQDCETISFGIASIADLDADIINGTYDPIARSLTFAVANPVEELAAATLTINDYDFDRNFGISSGGQSATLTGVVDGATITFVFGDDFDETVSGISSLSLSIEDACGNVTIIDDFALETSFDEGSNIQIDTFRPRRCFDQDLGGTTGIELGEAQLLTNASARDISMSFAPEGLNCPLERSSDYTYLWTAPSTAAWQVQVGAVLAQEIPFAIALTDYNPDSCATTTLGCETVFFSGDEFAMVLFEANAGDQFLITVFYGGIDFTPDIRISLN